jgi:hypothetical protein
VSGSDERGGVGRIEGDLAAMEELFSAGDAPHTIEEALEKKPFREAIPRALDCVLEALDRAKDLLVDPGDPVGDDLVGDGESARVDDDAADAAGASPVSCGLLAGAVRLICLLGGLIEFDCEDLAVWLGSAVDGGDAEEGDPEGGVRGGRVSRSAATSIACGVVRAAEALEQSIRDAIPERGTVPRAYWPSEGSWEDGPWLPATDEEIDAIAWWFVKDPRRRRQLEDRRVFLARSDLAAIQAMRAAERGAGDPPSNQFVLRRDAEAFEEWGLWAILPWEMVLCKWHELGRAAVRVWVPWPEKVPE